MRWFTALVFCASTTSVGATRGLVRSAATPISPKFCEELVPSLYAGPPSYTSHAVHAAVGLNRSPSTNSRASVRAAAVAGHAPTAQLLCGIWVLGVTEPGRSAIEATPALSTKSSVSPLNSDTVPVTETDAPIAG